MSILDVQQPHAPPTKHWSIDRDRTSVEFSVKSYWGLGTVRGRFDRFQGSYETGPEGRTIELTVVADSIDTGNGRRDTHLKSADFFDVADHPYVRFISTHVSDTDGGQLYGIGVLDAAGASEHVAFAAKIREVGDELEVEGTANVDHRWLGMSSGPLKMIRPPATLRVTARLV